MPLTDIGSYVTTGEEFEAHWTDVNADRVANTLAELVLPDGYAVAALTADVAEVEAAGTSQVSLENALTISTNGRDAQRAAVRQRMIDFRKLVEYQLKGSVYGSSL